MSDGFIEQGDTLPNEDVELQLKSLTTTPSTYNLTSQRGGYILDENDLDANFKELLHGRAYVIDKEVITAITSNDAVTYYIAADQTQGLIVPARAISLKSELSDAYYRWTDDGEKWTRWITIPDGTLHTYDVREMCRFAEVQVYTKTSGALFSLRATR